MINISDLMLEEHLSFDDALDFAQIKYESTEPIYLPTFPEPYEIRTFHHFKTPVFRLVGDGPHASRIRVTSPHAGILIDQRRVSPDRGWSCLIGGIGFDVHTGFPGERAPLAIWGQGTENHMQAMVELSQVQFGSPDKRSPTQGGPERNYPDAWLDLSGVIAATIQKCNFAGQRRGPENLESSYFPIAPIRISADAGLVSEPDGNLHSARSMKLTIKDCNFAPGCRYPIFVEDDAWTEGLTIADNRMVDVWGGILFKANPSNHGTGTALDIRDNHINFRRAGIDVQQGVADIRGNYLLPHAKGAFGARSFHIRLGSETGPIGPTLSHIRHNNLGISDPKNHPEFGIYIGAGCDRITVGQNNVQRVDHEIYISLGASNIVHV